MWDLQGWHPPVALGIDDAQITEDNLSLSLGWAGGGAPFQISKGETFHDLIWGGGGARWHLYRGDEPPANGYNLHAPHTEWVKRSYKKKGAWNGKGGATPPLSCMQHEGDVLYVPAGWYMGAVGCGQTLTISATLPPAPVFEPTTAWDPDVKGQESYVIPFVDGMAAVKAGAHDAALPLLRVAAEKTNERNDIVMYNLGRVLGHIDGTNGIRSGCPSHRVAHKETTASTLYAVCAPTACLAAGFSCQVACFLASLPPKAAATAALNGIAMVVILFWCQCWK